MVLSQELKHLTQRVEHFLEGELSMCKAADTSLQQAIEYSVLGGGKRVRPLLVYGSAYAAATDSEGLSLKCLDHIAASVEYVHCYSLVHDDLPAMDNDDLRRGQPTCHIAHGEANAILAGDALLTQAFELLTRTKMPASAQIAMIRTLSQAAGAQGMVGGQAIDLGAVATALSLDELKHMHQLKTGAMISASVKLGAIAAEPTIKDTSLVFQNLAHYADCLGLAFQIQDDILDVVANTAELGKTQGADAALNKPTYVSLLGLEGAQSELQKLLGQALDALRQVPGDTGILETIAQFVVNRNH